MQLNWSGRNRISRIIGMMTYCWVEIKFWILRLIFEIKACFPNEIALFIEVEECVSGILYMCKLPFRGSSSQCRTYHTRYVARRTNWNKQSYFYQFHKPIRTVLRFAMSYCSKPSYNYRERTTEEEVWTHMIYKALCYLIEARGCGGLMSSSQTYRVVWIQAGVDRASLIARALGEHDILLQISILSRDSSIVLSRGAGV